MIRKHFEGSYDSETDDDVQFEHGDNKSTGAGGCDRDKNDGSDNSDTDVEDVCGDEENCSKQDGAVPDSKKDAKSVENIVDLEECTENDVLRNGNLQYTVDEDDVLLWKSCSVKQKTRLIDFLQEDLNATVGGETVLTRYSVTDQLVTNMEEISNYAEKVVDVYKKLKLRPILNLVRANNNLCPFCNLCIDGKCAVLEHVKKHQKKLEENLESCTFCGVILPAGYMVYHPCVKKAQGYSKKIQVWFSDIRDFAAYVEMKLQFWNAEKAVLCQVCNVEQTNASAYWRHFMESHIQTFQCSCNEIFLSKSTIDLHVKPVPCKDNERVKQCKACQVVFPTVEELYVHLESVHEMTGEFMCEKCDICFACPSGLDEHKCVQKRSKGVYHCNIENCTETFSSYRGCMKHKHEKHGIKKYLCNLCGQRFLINSNLKTHQEWAHKIGESKECKICHQVFSGPNTLRSHMLSHATEYKYNCEICGKVYKYRAGLKVHMDHAHRKDQEKKLFTCEVCGSTYTKKGSLNHHIIISNHMTEKQKSAMRLAKKCKHCGKLFGCNTKLSRHISQVHMREKKHSCHFCGKGFDDTSNLRQHLQTHTGEKPNCEICKMSFRSRRKLCGHMMEAHNIQMELSRCDPLRNRKVPNAISNPPATVSHPHSGISNSPNLNSNSQSSISDHANMISDPQNIVSNSGSIIPNPHVTIPNHSIAVSSPIVSSIDIHPQSSQIPVPMHQGLSMEPRYIQLGNMAAPVPQNPYGMQDYGLCAEPITSRGYTMEQITPKGYLLDDTNIGQQ